MDWHSHLPPDEQAILKQMDELRVKLNDMQHARAVELRREIVGKFFRRNRLARWQEEDSDGWTVWTRVDFERQGHFWGLEIQEASPGELYQVEMRQSFGPDDLLGVEISRDEWDTKVEQVIRCLREGLPPFPEKE